MAIKVNYFSRIGLLVIQIIKLQINNTCKVMDSFIRKKLYFIYFTSSKTIIELRFQTK